MRIFSENIVVIQYFVRIGILAIIALQTYVMSQSRNSNGNRWLFALLLLAIPIYANDNEVFRCLFGVASLRLNIILYLPVVIVPIIGYFAILYYIEPRRKFTKRDAYIFIPVIINWVMLLPVIINPAIIHEWGGWSVYSFVSNFIFEPMYYIYSFSLIYRALRLLKEHSKSIMQLHSSLEQVDLKWLYGLNVSLFVLFISHMLRETLNIELLYDIGDIIAMVVLLYWSVILIQQREVFPYEITTIDLSNNDSQHDNTLFDLKAEELEVLMFDKEPYLNPEINLGDLACILNVRPQQLSKLIACRFSTNFYSYINKYRVERCKELLMNDAAANLSMEGIAVNAGFRSKSTFYARFKEFTGVTPTQYVEAASRCRNK